ncbi:hypothetical protein HYU11_05900 [Candidatus Woesearchaeota archaeon]|nr:hypothetical protein [Candidatus Woesearchaeota archaeon]
MALQVNLTYESIFDVLVREKGREELQKLGDTFFNDVASYIQNKTSLMESESNKDKVMQQIHNTKRMLRELYERREKKVMNMALVASRTSPGFIDTSNMLSVEKSLFEGLLSQLDMYRENVLKNILNSRQPIAFAGQEQKPAVPEPVNAPDPIENGKLIRFIKAVSSFVGKELEIYGPFEEGQTARIPVELADILINMGSAVEAKHSE